MHEPVTPTQQSAVAAYSARQTRHLTQTAHRVASDLLETLATYLQPGVSEADMRHHYEALCRERDITRSWHQPHIYFGPHTLLTAYDAKPSANRILGKNDIAYLDLGPIIPVDGAMIEGDVGKTYVFGEDEILHHLKRASEEIFQQARDFWAHTQPTGIALYQHIHQLAEARGLDFHLDPAGHLIGSFPHSGWRDGLDRYPHVPEPGIWILEIQLRHPTEPIGAFYEAVLL